MTILSRRILALALATLTIVPACSDDSSGTGGSLTPGEFAQSYTALLCDAIRSCCTEKGFDAAKVQCQVQGGASVDKINSATFDGARAQRCLDQLAARIKASDDACGDASSGGAASSDTPDCTPIFQKGTKAPGDTCSKSEECASVEDATVSCFRATSDAVGYCQVERVGKVDQGPCYNTILNGARVHVGEAAIDKLTEVYSCDLSQGLRCGDKGCVAVAQDGGACDPFQLFQCKQGSDCVGSVCKPQIAVGSACGDDDQASCVASAYCDASACKAKNDAGKPCTDDEQCVSGFCSDGACEGGGGFEDAGIALLCGAPLE